MYNFWFPSWIYTVVEFVILLFAFGVSGLVVATLIEDTFDRDCEGLYKGSIKLVIGAIVLSLVCIVLIVIFGEVQIYRTRC